MKYSEEHDLQSSTWNLKGIFLQRFEYELESTHGFAVLAFC
jgi:hypothetical protein